MSKTLLHRIINAGFFAGRKYDYNAEWDTYNGRYYIFVYRREKNSLSWDPVKTLEVPREEWNPVTRG